ncbi:hypothetical protein N7513_006260 [Penicillium frequentans]|nr:hypothetical protein N7513_006260 [Penicillium glabrum]
MTSGTSNPLPNLEVSGNNERDTELLDALEAVVPNIREAMDIFTEGHRSTITIFEELNRGIEKHLQQLEDKMQTVFIAYGNVNKKRRRSPSPMSRSSKAMLRSRSVVTLSEQITLEPSIHQ